MNQDKIGKFIAECRKKKNLTQQELAEKLGVSDRTIGNWENGRNMPDLALFQPLCRELDITLNDFMSGEKVKEKEYQEKLEENMMNAINYTNQTIDNRNHLIGLLLIIFGVLTAMTAIAIFPSESSWSFIYSILGVILSFIGVSKFTKHLTYLKRLFYNLGYFFLFIILLMIIDYISVVNIHQAPRFSLVKVSGDKIIYYDTPFYDVVRCNVDEEDEVFKIMINQKYDSANIDQFCK